MQGEHSRVLLSDPQPGKKNEQTRVHDSGRVLKSGFVYLHARFASFVIAWLRSSVKKIPWGVENSEWLQVIPPTVSVEFHLSE